MPEFNPSSTATQAVLSSSTIANGMNFAYGANLFLDFGIVFMALIMLTVAFKFLWPK